MDFSVPASLYVASRLLVPETDPRAPVSLEDRLGSIRTPFLVFVAYPWLPGTIGNLASGDVPAALLLASVGVLALLGIPFKERFQVPLLAAMSATYLVFLVLFRTRISDLPP